MRSGRRWERIPLPPNGTSPSVEGAPNHLQTTWVWIGVSYLAEQPPRCDLLKVSLQDPPICPQRGRASQRARRKKKLLPTRRTAERRPADSCDFCHRLPAISVRDRPTDQGLCHPVAGGATGSSGRLTGRTSARRPEERPTIGTSCTVWQWGTVHRCCGRRRSSPGLPGAWSGWVAPCRSELAES